jgi:hypothetical protein
VKLSPQELVHFFELWSALGMKPRRAAELLESRMRRRVSKRSKAPKAKRRHAGA